MNTSVRVNGTAAPQPILDVAGIGIGPSNLSVAALLAPLSEPSAQFLEARSEFTWHEGLLLDHAFLQSPYLKDLVSLVDPTSRYSFLNYLAKSHRLHRFIVADFPNVPRKEFNRYFRWVCSDLHTLQFGTPVTEVTFEEDHFAVCSGKQRWAARHIVLGVGREPNIPREAEHCLGPTVFHASTYLSRRLKPKDQRIIVVGGGQSGAEIFYELISRTDQLPAEVTWVTRRHNFIPFDESPFANELYVPRYTEAFYRKPQPDRERLLELQKYSSDGIVDGLLQDIYRRLYELDFLTARRHKYRLLTDRVLARTHREGSSWHVVTSGPGGREETRADVVILATGFRFAVPSFLEPLAHLLPLDALGRYFMNSDFSLLWDGAPENRIYAHNAALHSHGWVDPNFAGMAWRSAKILNSIAEREVYDLHTADTAVDWSAGDPADEFSPLALWSAAGA